MRTLISSTMCFWLQCHIAFMILPGPTPGMRSLKKWFLARQVVFFKRASGITEALSSIFPLPTFNQRWCLWKFKSNEKTGRVRTENSLRRLQEESINANAASADLLGLGSRTSPIWHSIEMTKREKAKEGAKQIR